MRTERLFTLLSLLRATGRVSAGRLAEILGVSVRTVLRDLSSLENCGFVIVAERGRDGGFRLEERAGTRAVRLSLREAEALPFASSSAASIALGLEAAAHAARAKTITALPRSAQTRAAHATARFYQDPADWYTRLVVPPLLRAVADATWNDQVVAIDYESWHRRATRVIEPLGIVQKASNWYVMGRRRKRVSIYRIDNIYAMRVVPGKKVSRGSFNLERTWNLEAARFEASLRRQKARLRVGTAALDRISILGADAAKLIRSASPDHEDCRVADIWIESIPHAATLLISFGTDIEVLLPAELRREMLARARAITSLYAEHEPRQR